MEHYDAVFLFINIKGATVKGKFYLYDDKTMLKHRTNEYEGMKIRTDGDKYLIDITKPMHVIVRETVGHPFIYYGQTVNPEVVSLRTTTDPPRIKYDFDTNAGIVAPLTTLKPPTRSSTNKEYVFQALNAVPVIKNWRYRGIVPVRFIKQE